MSDLRLLCGQPDRNPFLASLGLGVDLAYEGETRCTHRSGRLRCVRRPHPEHPGAHVPVVGFDDGTGSGAAPEERGTAPEEVALDHGTAA